MKWAFLREKHEHRAYTPTHRLRVVNGIQNRRCWTVERVSVFECRAEASGACRTVRQAKRVAAAVAREMAR